MHGIRGFFSQYPANGLNERFRQALAALDHRVRWETPTTLHGWEQAGTTSDSTLSYADHAGFRCGIC